MAEPMEMARPVPTVISLPIRYRPASKWIPVLALVVGLGLLGLDSAFGYVILALAVVAGAAVVNLERFRRSEVASMRALVSEPPGEPVTLVPIVTEARLRTRLRMQFLLRDAGGVDRAMAWIVPDRERFDPHATVFVHGAAEPGRSVALANASGNTALLPFGALRPVPHDPAAAARTRPLVALLGWDAPAPSSGSSGSGGWEAPAIASPAPMRSGTRIGPDQFGGSPVAGFEADGALAASMERVDWVRRHIDSSPLVVLVLIAVGFSGGLVWWLPALLLASVGYAVARLRAWQAGPVAQQVVAAYGVSRREATRIAVAYLGLHGAKVPPAA